MRLLFIYAGIVIASALLAGLFPLLLRSGDSIWVDLLHLPVYLLLAAFAWRSGNALLAPLLAGLRDAPRPAALFLRAIALVSLALASAALSWLFGSRLILLFYYFA